MQDILDIIDDALKRKGLSASAASRLAVGNPSLIKNMRHGTAKTKRYNVEALRKLASVLDLEFYFGEERAQIVVQLPGGFAERTFEPAASANARQEALELGFLPIPYHRAAAPDFRGTAPVALARQWLVASGLRAEGLAFLPVLTDEMAPTLMVGTLALIDTAQSDGRDDDIWALSIKGRYGFARLQRPGPGMVILKRDAPKHSIEVLTGDALSTLRVLGKVVWIAHQT